MFDLSIDCFVFYTVPAIFQPWNGGFAFGNDVLMTND